MTLQVSLFQTLPNEMIIEIFSYLDAAALISCSKANKQFHEILQNEELLKALFPDVVLSPGQSMKDHIVMSRKGILKQVDNFIQTIQFGQRGEITFKYTANTNISIRFDYAYDLNAQVIKEKTLSICQKIPTLETKEDVDDETPAPAYTDDRMIGGQIHQDPFKVWTKSDYEGTFIFPSATYCMTGHGKKFDSHKVKTLFKEIKPILENRISQLNKQELLQLTKHAAIAIASTVATLVNVARRENQG